MAAGKKSKMKQGKKTIKNKREGRKSLVFVQGKWKMQLRCSSASPCIPPWGCWMCQPSLPSDCSSYSFDPRERSCTPGWFWHTTCAHVTIQHKECWDIKGLTMGCCTSAPTWNLSRGSPICYNLLAISLGLHEAVAGCWIIFTPAITRKYYQ